MVVVVVVEEVVRMIVVEEVVVEAVAHISSFNGYHNGSHTCSKSLMSQARYRIRQSLLGCVGVG